MSANTNVGVDSLAEERAAILALTGGATVSEHCRNYRQRHKALGLCIWCPSPRACGPCPICEKNHIAGVYCVKHKVRRIHQELHRYAGLRRI